MRKLFIALLAGVAALVAAQASAQTIIDAALPDNLFQIGVRAGFNTANLSNNNDDLGGAQWNDNLWRSGFTAGAVFDINFRNFFAIQPGAFITTRRSEYHLLYIDGTSLKARSGKQSANYLQIPILASLRLGVPQLAQVHIDLGPYFAWGWGGDDKYTDYEAETNPATGAPDAANKVVVESGKKPMFGDSSDALCKRYDYGVKTGVGLMVMQHYYVGAHFMYGCRDAIKADGQKGHNKMWTFTVGYNF